jgi:tetratricopeptide (TPR) repeat protein
MKKNLMVCAAFFVMAFGFSVNIYAQNFVSDEDEFSVWFPIKPGIENQDVSGVSVRTYLVSKPDLTMTIVVNGFLSEVNESEQKAVIYDDSAASMLKRINGNLIGSRDIMIAGQNAREIKFTSDGLTTIVRYLIIKDRLFQFVVSGTAKSLQSAFVKKFFDSFKYTGKLTAPIINSSAISAKIDALMMQGKQLFDDKKYAEAVKIYGNVLKLDANYESAYFYRGSSFYESKQYVPAIADFTKAVKLSDKNDILVENLYNRALAYIANKNTALALADCDKIITLNANYWQAYFQRGNINYNLKKISLALTDYTKTIELNPEYATAYLYRADCYDQLGQKKLADQDRQTALSFDE